MSLGANTSVTGCYIYNAGVYLYGDNEFFTNFSMKNCLLYGSGPTNTSIYMNTNMSDPITCTSDLTVENCTMTAGFSGGIYWQAYQGYVDHPLTQNTTIKSTYSGHSNGPDFFQDDGGGSPTTFNTVVTASASSDSTADDWGGSGNLISKQRTDCFIDPAEPGLNFNLKKDSPLRNTGTTTALTTDITGRTRPQEGTNDIGAFEYPFLPKITMA